MGQQYLRAPLREGNAQLLPERPQERPACYVSREGQVSNLEPSPFLTMGVLQRFCHSVTRQSRLFRWEAHFVVQIRNCTDQCV